MSAAERDKCSLSSLLPMSCRDRAAAFARHLHNRLSSLDSESDGSPANESSWLGAHENTIAVSHQPRHTTDSELYFNFGLLDSPGSPEEEVTESELSTLINNKDNLQIERCENCNCPKTISFTTLKKVHAANSHDSDSSDGPYYDTESEGYQKSGGDFYLNGVSESPENGEDDIRQLERVLENHVHESPPTLDLENGENHIDCINSDSNYESPVTSERSGLVQTCNDEESTLSLRDEDYPSLEYSSTSQDLPLLENQDLIEDNSKDDEENNSNNDVETYSSCLNVEKDYTVECLLANVHITKCETLEKDDTPIESRAFLEVCSNNVDGDDDSDDGKETPIPRVRRCSSLKTGKTPPGTPGRKKIVRFADVLGLDLADVRTFLDEIPKVPTSAYDDLVDVDFITSVSDSSLSSCTKSHPSAGFKPERILFPLFQQPGGQPNFLEKVKEKNACLENAVVNDPIDLSIAGTIRVRNLDFHKSVHIRYTLDSWKTYADLQATYIENSCDGFSDKFTFLLYAHTLTIGQKLEFAVRFQCKGCQYWDNNYGANYCFQCLPASNNASYLSTNSGPYDNNWDIASFY